jgi:CDAN1-interacting nuclease 1
MLQAEYDAICPRLRSREDVAAASAASGGRHSYETLLSVYGQAYIRQMARSNHIAKRHGDEFCRRYDRGDSLLDVAEWINLSPCTVARRFLEIRLGAGRTALTKMLRNSASIPDERIRREVQECVENDEHGGPYMDRQRGVIGLEYEFILMEKLRSLGLQFETESDLRARGTFKTPDVLLSVPVAFGGRIVRWIDSKGKFGDEYFLRKDYTDAVSSYIGRFGPGMVVYWFGFIQDCDSPMLSDAGVYLADDIPSEVVMLPGTIPVPPNQPGTDDGANIDECGDVENISEPDDTGPKQLMALVHKVQAF